MTNKTKVKISLDVVMFLILIVMYNSKVISLNFHEIAGLGVFSLFLIHCMLNLKWVTSAAKKFFSKVSTTKLRIKSILNLLLFISFLMIIVSGIMISKIIFHIDNSSFIWKTLHYFFSALSLLILGIHIGLHKNYIFRLLFNRIHLSTKITRPFCVVCLAFFVAFGGYSIVKSDFSRWISMPFISMPQPTGDRPLPDESFSRDNFIPDENMNLDKAFPEREIMTFSAFNAVKVGFTYTSILVFFGIITSYFEKFIIFIKRKKKFNFE